MSTCPHCAPDGGEANGAQLNGAKAPNGAQLNGAKAPNAAQLNGAKAPNAAQPNGAQVPAAVQPNAAAQASPQAASRSHATIALLGQPNSGKSTLFNGLTGSRQHVGNWPGKTVERRTGTYSHGGASFEVCDLPGSYSLTANSPEEEITREYIACGAADVTCVLVDASQLERSLYMLAEFAGAPCPAILVLNLMDVAQGQGKRIDASVIEERIGIPVVPLVAADPKHYEAFHASVSRALAERPMLSDAKLRELTAKRAAAMAKYPSSDVRVTGAAKFDWVRWAIDGAQTGSRKAAALSKFDRLATGSRWSKPITLGMILLGFLLAFIPATPIMGLGSLVSMLGIQVAGWMIAAGLPDMLASFVSGVLFNSVCFALMMSGYVFGINLVFGVCEETGYMARISYVFDAAMARFGLQGKSVMPFLMCFGCTIGGASGSRVIDSWGQRMLTVAMAWAIPCGSTWGVVPVLAVAFFGLGAPLVIVAIFAVCILLMWIIGRLFGPRLVDPDERAGMVMELPPYHKPRWKNALRNAYLKAIAMIRRAIRVVLIFTCAIWLLTYTPTGIVEDSLIYMIGSAIEPITSFFGLGWKTFTAWLCALVLKESALGVLSGLFAGGATPNAAIIGAATGSVAAATNIGEIMAAAISRPEALAFIFAFTFNMPCAASVSATYAEVHSAKWTALTAVFYICSSLVLACVVYHVSLLFL